MAVTRKTNAQYSAETQRKLLDAARRELARLGYAETATERIVALAGVTRGALYHHYAGKRELFEAVFEELSAEIAQRIERRAARAREPFAALVAGCEAWLDACLDPEVQQIALLDAPAVLGWRRWTEIDAQHGTGRLREGIDACLAAGVFTGVDALALTRLVAGALNEVALLLAAAPPKDAPKLRRDVGRTLRALLEGLRAT